MNSYFDNPGMPTDAERGTYCPHGEKIVDVERGSNAGDSLTAVPVEPWPCNRSGCTREKFEEILAEMEVELAEAERRTTSCAEKSRFEIRVVDVSELAQEYGGDDSLLHVVWDKELVRGVPFGRYKTRFRAEARLARERRKGGEGNGCDS